MRGGDKVSVQFLALILAALIVLVQAQPAFPQDSLAKDNIRVPIVYTSMVGGRPLIDSERYRVATMDTLATSETYQAVFHDEARAGFRLHGEDVRHGKDSVVLVSDLVLARLNGMKTRWNGFTPGFLDELGGLLHDDGGAFEPRWSLAVKPFEGSFQQFKVSNRDPFGSVRNSRINTPDNTNVRAKGNVALT